MVREATTQDARAVARMLHDFNTEFGEPSPGPDVLAGRLERLLAGDDMAALLADDHGVALLTFRPSVWDEGPVALLEELYVRPDRRGQGIGGELLERSFELARERGCETYQVNVDEPDADAQRFYEAHGVARDALYFERRL